MPPKLPETAEQMIALLAERSDAELQEMFQAQLELEKKLEQYGPQNDDELHAWIKRDLNFDIPRVSVCDSHDAPFDFLADLYFERTDAALLMANRGGAKTFLVAILHWLNSRFKPGCESCTFGATEAQSFRAYAHLKGWVYDDEGNRRPEIIGSMMRETVFKNGSKVEVLSGTPEAVNGPHPQKAHADEIELMREDTWAESRNMTVSKRMPGGRLIKPQDIATSTRKGPNGRMQQLIDEITEAVAAGYKPPRKLYQWCIKETAAPVRNCQVARPDIAEAIKCPCHTIKKGEWEDGSPRLLRDICNGDFYRSGGWQPYGDVVKQFTENDPETFDVQQLCSKPEMRFHYVPNWRDERHCIRSFTPYPENGPIFMSVDWGGTNPHAVNWYQLLRYEIEVETWVQPNLDKRATTRLKEGTIVCFDEIYIAEIGNDKLADLVKQRENSWALRLPGFRIYERFADPQGKAARMDWKARGLQTRWHATREFEEHVKLVRDFFSDDLFRVDGERCKNFVAEVKEWRADPKTGRQIDEHNHCFHGETLIQTRDGLRMARDLAGETVEVLTQGGDYRPAPWRSYGERDVYEVEFADGERVRVTDGHQWVVQRDSKGQNGTGTERVTTLELEGRRVPTQPAHWAVEDADAYARGVQNGLIYGDGTTANGYSWMHQYGEENCSILEQFFERHTDRHDSPHGVKVSTKMLPVALKQAPAEEVPDYIRGFLAGLIAADGAVNKQGCCYIASSKREDIDRIVTLCRSVGVVVTKVEERQPGPGAYPNGKTQFRIWITKGSLDETLLLKPSHRANGLRQMRWAKSYTVKVVAVRRAGRAEVFCCTEPVTHTVVLGSGKLSSQCMSEFRYALANIRKVQKRAMKSALPRARAIPRQTVSVSKKTEAPIGFRGKQKSMDEWRKSLGEPVTRVTSDGDTSYTY